MLRVSSAFGLSVVPTGSFAASWTEAGSSDWPFSAVASFETDPSSASTLSGFSSDASAGDPSGALEEIDSLVSLIAGADGRLGIDGGEGVEAETVSAGMSCSCFSKLAGAEGIFSACDLI